MGDQDNRTKFLRWLERAPERLERERGEFAPPRHVLPRGVALLHEAPLDEDARGRRLLREGLWLGSCGGDGIDFDSIFRVLDAVSFDHGAVVRRADTRLEAARDLVAELLRRFHGAARVELFDLLGSLPAEALAAAAAAKGKVGHLARRLRLAARNRGASPSAEDSALLADCDHFRLVLRLYGFRQLLRKSKGILDAGRVSAVARLLARPLQGAIAAGVSAAELERLGFSEQRVWRETARLLRAFDPERYRGLLDEHVRKIVLYTPRK